MSHCHKLVGTIRIDPAREMGVPVASADDSTLEQLLTSFAHGETLLSGDSLEPSRLITRSRLSRSVLAGADAMARADLAVLMQELDDEFTQLAAALTR